MLLERLKKVPRYILIANALAIVQVIALIAIKWHRSAQTQTFNEAMETAIQEIPGQSDEQQTLTKIHIAITTFRSANEGKLPNSLQELVPTYFKEIPINPNTMRPFDYSVDGETYSLGEQTRIAVAALKTGDVPQAELTKTPMTKEEEQALLAYVLEKDKNTFVYDHTGKRDPFRQFNAAPEIDADDTSSPLARYQLGQLKLTAVLMGIGEPSAIVEDSVGKGFTVRKGMRIGTRGGIITEILDDRILILETLVDFTGRKVSNKVELILNKGGEESI